MLFNSFHFLLFFIFIGVAYYALPHKYRWFLLLTGSCYFYMAFVPIYILILGFTIVVDYFAAQLIERAEGRKRKLFLVVSLIVNIGVLAVFKYYNFFNANLTAFLNGFAVANPVPYLSILLPIGLSFHTFQAMSYTIEVYRGHHPAERHFGIYALYVMFFPQLVAGPIERPGNLIYQFKEKHHFEYDRVVSGLRLIAWGLFKKVVIADRLAVVVETVTGNPGSFNSLSLIISSVFFAFQAYCDFSGYSDIAIGSARVLGFKLMKNFDFPYHSRSFFEFWKRWHISLSSWFRDYLYIPLGGNRVSVPRWYLNIMIVFLVSGLWHGANWTYVLFGGIQGFYIVFGIATKKFRAAVLKRLHLDTISAIPLVTTFLLFVFSLIFFSARDLGSALLTISRIFSGLPDLVFSMLNGKPVLEYMGLSPLDMVLSFVLIIILETVHYLQRNMDIVNYFNRQPVYIRWGVYYLVVNVILVFGVFENRQFIYFQF